MQLDGTTLTWRFPLPRPHAGVLIGNGIQGLMVWGDERLIVTVGRAGFWDRRGGRTPMLDITFAELRGWLEAGDEAAIRRAFSGSSDRHGFPARPFQIGGGRLELALPDGARPRTARLNLHDGGLEIDVRPAHGNEDARITIGQSPGDEVFWITVDPSLLDTEITLRPSWEFVHEELARWGYAAPQEWGNRHGGGFVQETPEDDALALVWARSGETIVAATALAATGSFAREHAAGRAGGAATPPAERIALLTEEREEWWHSYWDDVPSVDLPDPVLQRAWLYGLYKQAGLTPPYGPAATLQGAWMESYQLPPWSNDYHFNINLEMIYGPALVSNRLGHLGPLWEMIERWLPTLRQYGESFFGARGALMLPHAVDDHGHVVGQFWTGTIDHACTAWVAILAWQHYRYSLDESVLRRVGWPLLNGAFEGYWAMVEGADDSEAGRTLSLPVSVSPEFREDKMSAWGRDASFQLAALHAVCEALTEAATILHQELDVRWERVRLELPPYTLYPDDLDAALAERPAGDWNPVPRIALWKGQDLVESHRHHSHLASIYPFRSIDPLSENQRRIVANSLRHWTKMGAGLWTGWCLPWAAVICARCNLADAALSWLHWWNDVYVNVGGGTLHNADFAGAALMDDGGFAQLAGERTERRPEVMQMDAAMGAVTAIAELLVQSRHGVIHVLPALPREWRELSFARIRAEGAFFVSARVEDRARVRVTVESEKGGELRLAHGIDGAWTARVRGRNGREAATARAEHGCGPLFEALLRAGDVVEITHGKMTCLRG